MNDLSLLKATPWDTIAFGVPTWEVLEYSSVALGQTQGAIGHYTIKVDPLADKQLLHDSGFYYCDTLIEPYCCGVRLREVFHADATISKSINTEAVLKICHGAFLHGRFHRDFNLSKMDADKRYDSWLEQLIMQGQVYGLFWQDLLAGFIGHNENQLILHAISPLYRGRGLSKYWWSAVCREILMNRNEVVKSSISVSNVSALNLYVSLGFSFRNPKDIYHRLIL